MNNNKSRMQKSRMNTKYTNILNACVFVFVAQSVAKPAYDASY